MYDFKGKVVAVTGSAKGLGKTIAKRFYNFGAKVAICGLEEDYSDDVLKEIAGDDDSRIFGMPADLRDIEQIKAYITGTVNKFGRIDILINNAGIIHNIPSLEVTAEKWDSLFDTNIRNYFFTSQQFIKHVIDRKGTGVIVSISSVQAEYIVNGCVAYTASKAATNAMTKCLAKEFGKSGIRVNAIGPGSFPSDLNKEKYSEPNTLKALEDRLPLSRQGSQDEIANGVLFLASEEASYITGQVLYIDGGFLLS
jgi:NAD(P)-dependent dehydrogenase (short-subunit alcohol dehydrogenase family)